MTTKVSRKTVYFAGAIRGDRVAADMMKSLITFIIDSGFQVLTEHVKADIPTDAKLSAEEIEKRDISWIDEATYFVAEISGASTGTGREVEYARSKGSKVLCLYQKEREFYASPMIRGMTPDRYLNVKVAGYDSLDEAKKLVAEFLSS